MPLLALVGLAHGQALREVRLMEERALADINKLVLKTKNIRDRTDVSNQNINIIDNFRNKL